MSTATLYPRPPVVPDPTAPFDGMAGHRKFTVAEYHEMIRDGVLTTADPVELLEGYLVLQMARGPRHDHAVAYLSRLLSRMLSDDWWVGPQTAATLSESEPKPDVSVARGGLMAFTNRHPGPADIALLVEASDSSLTRDRRDKARIYARDGIPVYWIVSVPDRRIEVYTDPDPAADPPAYRTVTAYPVGEAVPVVLDGATVGQFAVADVIPPGQS